MCMMLGWSDSNDVVWKVIKYYDVVDNNRMMLFPPKWGVSSPYKGFLHLIRDIPLQGISFHNGFPSEGIPPYVGFTLRISLDKYCPVWGSSTYNGIPFARGFHLYWISLYDVFSFLRDVLPYTGFRSIRDFPLRDFPLYGISTYNDSLYHKFHFILDFPLRGMSSPIRSSHYREAPVIRGLCLYMISLYRGFPL